MRSRRFSRAVSGRSESGMDAVSGTRTLRERSSAGGGTTTSGGNLRRGISTRGGGRGADGRGTSTRSRGIGTRILDSLGATSGAGGSGRLAVGTKILDDDDFIAIAGRGTNTFTERGSRPNPRIRRGTRTARSPPGGSIPSLSAIAGTKTFRSPSPDSSSGSFATGSRISRSLSSL